MFDNLKKWLGKQPKYKQGKKIGPKIVISASYIDELKNCMTTEINIGHEDVAYLLGQTDGNTTLVVSAVRPQSTSTPGSFHVSSVAMTSVMPSIDRRRSVSRLHATRRHSCSSLSSNGVARGCLFRNP